VTSDSKYLCLTCGLVHELRFGRCHTCDGEVRRWGLVRAVLVGQGLLPREEPPAPVEVRPATDEEQRQALERSLDERGPDGVSERWKRQFIPGEVRQLADEILATRYPKPDAAWLPIVDWARLASELSGITFGENWLRLHYQLGPVSSTLVLTLAEVRLAQPVYGLPPVWQTRIERELLRLRHFRAELVVSPQSDEELDANARARARQEGPEPEPARDPSRWNP